MCGLREGEGRRGQQWAALVLGRGGGVSASEVEWWGLGSGGEGASLAGGWGPSAVFAVVTVVTTDTA